MSRGRGAFYKAKYGGGRSSGALREGGVHLPTNEASEDIQDAKYEVQSDSPLCAKGTDRDLDLLLRSIENQTYGRYQTLRGYYTFNQCTLGIVHIQGDPYAPPSRIFFRIPISVARIPEQFLSTPCRAIALADFFARNLFRLMKSSGADCRTEGPGWGSGKGGELLIDQASQCVLQRTNVQILPHKGYVEARFGVGLPARGRTILAQWASKILLETVPSLCHKSLAWPLIDIDKAVRHIETVENQQALRYQLAGRNLVGFIPDGAILPRQHGSSDLPLDPKTAIPFSSPPSLRCTLSVPNGPPVVGMGIPKGVTLIVGGGYHGKTTLLEALKNGVYDHVPGDGRDGVVCDNSAIKIRAEDGRSVQQLNISAFINGLPFGRSTKQFSSEDASGSTSQAANITEACELGTSLLLLDEDTCATNFMFRDEKMTALVYGHNEPITPFRERVQALYIECGVSTVLVMGSCGSFFDVADTVLMLDAYQVHDVSERAKAISSAFPQPLLGDTTSASTSLSSPFSVGGLLRPLRTIDLTSLPSGGAKVPNLTTIAYCGVPRTEDDPKSIINLSAVEQLAEIGQTRMIADIIRYLSHLAPSKNSLLAILENLESALNQHGLDLIAPRDRPSFGGYVRPRRFELAAAINRWRGLRGVVAKRERAPPENEL